MRRTMIVGQQWGGRLAIMATVSLALAGCSGSDALKSPTAARLRGLSSMYLNYAAAKGSGPPSEQVFRQYLAGLDAIALQVNGINPKAIDEIFVSERDN